MGVRKPKQTQQADDKHLANNGKTINNEGDQSACDGRFNQVEQVHNAAQLTTFSPRSQEPPFMDGPRTTQAAPIPREHHFVLQFLYALFLLMQVKTIWIIKIH
jgi:hypothetical protein